MISAKRSTFWLAACWAGISPGRANAQAAPAAAEAPAAAAQAPAVAVDEATRAAARDLGAAGTSAYLAGDFDEASEKLERAFQLMPVPSLALWSARAFAKRGLLVEAAERYSKAPSLELGPGNPEVQLKAQRSAAAEHAELMPRVPHLRVQLEGAAAEEVTVMVDGVASPALVIGEDWPVNAGAHRVMATRGAERAEASAEVSEGQRSEVVLRFSAPAPEGQSHIDPAANAAGAAPAAIDDVNPVPWRSIGWITVGVGGAALVTSGILGIVAKQKGDGLRSSNDCVDNRCVDTPEARDYNRLVDFSTVGWIGGAVLVGAGTLLVLTAPGSGGSVEVGLGLSEVSVKGRF